MRSAWMILAVLGLATPTLAQEAGCISAETQLEMNMCSLKEWQAADAVLNDVYVQAMETMKRVDGYLDAKDRGAAKALKTGQRAWITYRDEACAAEAYSAFGGTAQSMILNQCLTRLTMERTDGLMILAASDAD